MPQKNGFAMILLWCELREDDDFDPDADKTARERLRDQMASRDPYFTVSSCLLASIRFGAYPPRTMWYVSRLTEHNKNVSLEISVS
jgi:hypothetical protein